MMKTFNLKNKLMPLHQMRANRIGLIKSHSFFASVCYLSLILSAFGILSACTTKSVPRTENAPAIDTRIQAPATVPASADELMQMKIASLSGDIKKNIIEDIKNAKSEADLKAILVKLSDFVMNANYVEDRHFSTTPELLAMLTSYNSALLKLNQLKPIALNDLLSEKYKTSILETYLKFVLSGCSEKLKDCVNISFFASDSQSARVLEIKIKQLDGQITQSKAAQAGQCAKTCLELIAQYYKLVGLTYDLRNTILDPELEFLYLKHAREFAQYFEQLPNDQKDPTMLQRHIKVFEKIIENYRPDIQSAEFAQFVADFSPWTYSRLEANPFPHGTGRMFNFAAQGFLYDQKSQALSSSFLEALKSTQLKEDRFGQSFSQKLQTLKSTDTALIDLLSPEEKRMQQALLSNEYFFMVDRLYRGHLNSDEVKQIWNGSHKDIRKFLSSIQYYMKVTFLNALLETNKYMRAIYDKKEYAANTMVIEIIQKSQYISDQWIDMLGRFTNIANFMNEVLKQDGVDLAEMRQTNDIFSSIKRNIKYISVYPNMMLLVYQLADSNASVDVKTPWGVQIKFDAADIGKRLFLGADEAPSEPPWFNFGDDQIGLNRTEMLFAYYFALVTKTFEVFTPDFAQSKSAVSDLRKSYFTKVIKPYLNDDFEVLRRGSRLYESNINSSIYQEMTQHYCPIVAAALAKNPNETHFNFSLLRDISDFNYFAAPGVATEKAFTRSVQNIYNHSFSPSMEFSQTANTLMIKVTLVETMIDILDQNLMGLHWSDTQRNEFLKDVRAQVDEVKSEIINYYNLAVKYHYEISDCLNQFYKIEVEREKTLIANEEFHLSGIYEVMTWMQSDDHLKALQISSKELNEAQFQKIIGLLKTQNKLPKDYNFKLGRDRITKDNYNLQKLELFRRFKDAQLNMQPQVEVRRNLESDESTLEAYAISSNISYQANKNDFLQDGLQTSFSAASSTSVKWLENANLAKVQKEKIETLVELYRFGSLFNLKYDRKITASDLISEQLKLAQIFNIDEATKSMFAKLRTTSIYKAEDYDRILINIKTGTRSSILENVFLSLANNSQIKAETESFAKSILNVGQFLFQPSKEVAALMRSHYRPLVQNMDSMLKQFILATHQREQDDKAHPITQIRYSVEQNTDHFYVTPQDSAGRPIYLNANLITNYLSEFDRFMLTTTSKYFAPHEGDLECSPTSPGHGNIETCGSSL